MLSFVLITLFVTLGIQYSCFLIAASLKFDKITDLAGTTNFLVLALLTFFLRGTYFTRQIVDTVLVSVWALRLGSFLFYRVIKRGKDDRFDEIRENFWRFFGFWTFQVIWVFVCSLALTMLNEYEYDAPIDYRDIIGWCLWGIGFFFQTAADMSKLFFTEDPANRGHFIRSGVWSLSRHPNYFGEISMWLGIFVSSLPAVQRNTDWGYFGVASPVLAFLLLMFVSGVNLGETSYDQRFGDRADYWAYKEQTSVLIPCLPIIYRNLPGFVKLIFFFEFPFYTHRRPDDMGQA